ncbi:hypothetical protein [Streptomyces lonarensis]|uniref:Uncharacterized protein n=1 Tax=Streptomyces lonarensis TaxID=700599 RepID=A0A7X6CX65_9ACTN|nr:hypothetical protein [Streptomyces lonarensis]NJQ04236.1 hypothetical protein [Streptomyces lonarensis]
MSAPTRADLARRHAEISELFFRAAAAADAGDTAAAEALADQARQLAEAIPTGGAR